MQSGFNAYAAAARSAQNTASPRELEASLLLKASVRLQSIIDDWAGRSRELDEALNDNRKLWTLLVSAVIAIVSPSSAVFPSVSSRNGPSGISWDAVLCLR